LLICLFLRRLGSQKSANFSAKFSIQNGNQKQINRFVKHSVVSAPFSFKTAEIQLDVATAEMTAAIIVSEVIDGGRTCFLDNSKINVSKQKVVCDRSLKVVFHCGRLAKLVKTLFRKGCLEKKIHLV